MRRASACERIASVAPCDLHFAGWGKSGREEEPSMIVRKGDVFKKEHYVEVFYDWRVTRTKKERARSLPLSQCQYNLPNMVVEARRTDRYEELVGTDIRPTQLWQPLEERRCYELWGFLSVIDDEACWLVSAPHGEGDKGLEHALRNTDGIFVGRALLL